MDDELHPFVRELAESMRRHGVRMIHRRCPRNDCDEYDFEFVEGGPDLWGDRLWSYLNDVGLADEG